MVTKLSVLKQGYHFSSDSFVCDGIKDLCDMLTTAAGQHYDEIKEILHNEAFLSDHDEKSLLKLCNEMIACDSIGYFGMNSSMILNVGEHEENLNVLIGLDSVKTSIQKIKAYALAKKNASNLNLHMCFYGNPGTGKTEVARIIAGILHENGILPTNRVVETDHSGLVAGYVGQTALKTLEKVEEAMGGVLLIDEAYSLVKSDSGSDYGHEAVAALIKAMEDYRGKFCVILAGYKEPMQKLLSSNPGFASRIQFSLDFPDYTREELMQLTDVFLSGKQYEITPDALEKLLDIVDYFRRQDDFANARTLCNILDQVIMNQNLRAEDDEEDCTIILSDVEDYLLDEGIELGKKSTKGRIGFI